MIETYVEDTANGIKSLMLQAMPAARDIVLRAGARGWWPLARELGVRCGMD